MEGSSRRLPAGRRRHDGFEPTSGPGSVHVACIFLEPAEDSSTTAANAPRKRRSWQRPPSKPAPQVAAPCMDYRCQIDKRPLLGPPYVRRASMHRGTSGQTWHSQRRDSGWRQRPDHWHHRHRHHRARRHPGPDAARGGPRGAWPRAPVIQQRHRPERPHLPGSHEDRRRLHLHYVDLQDDRTIGKFASPGAAWGVYHLGPQPPIKASPKLRNAPVT